MPTTIEKHPLAKPWVAEFLGTFALIFIGIGSIYHLGGLGAGGLLGIALAHGLTIAVMVTATGAISGGHLNPAVTFGLLVGGQINTRKAVHYWFAQLAGAIAAAALCMKVGGVGGAAVGAGGPPRFRAWGVICNGIPGLA